MNHRFAVKQQSNEMCAPKSAQTESLSSSKVIPSQQEEVAFDDIDEFPDD